MSQRQHYLRQLNFNFNEGDGITHQMVNLIEDKADIASSATYATVPLPVGVLDNVFTQIELLDLETNWTIDHSRLKEDVEIPIRVYTVAMEYNRRGQWIPQNTNPWVNNPMIDDVDGTRYEYAFWPFVPAANAKAGGVVKFGKGTQVTQLSVCQTIVDTANNIYKNELRQASWMRAGVSSQTGWYTGGRPTNHHGYNLKKGAENEVGDPFHIVQASGKLCMEAFSVQGLVCWWDGLIPADTVTGYPGESGYVGFDPTPDYGLGTRQFFVGTFFLLDFISKPGFETNTVTDTKNGRIYCFYETNTANSIFARMLGFPMDIVGSPTAFGLLRGNMFLSPWRTAFDQITVAPSWVVDQEQGMLDHGIPGNLDHYTDIVPSSLYVGSYSGSIVDKGRPVFAGGQHTGSDALRNLFDTYGLSIAVDGTLPSYLTESVDARPLLFAIDNIYHQHLRNVKRFEFIPVDSVQAVSTNFPSRPTTSAHSASLLMPFTLDDPAFGLHPFYNFRHDAGLGPPDVISPPYGLDPIQGDDLLFAELLDESVTRTFVDDHEERLFGTIAIPRQTEITTININDLVIDIFRISSEFERTYDYANYDESVAVDDVYSPIYYTYSGGSVFVLNTSVETAELAAVQLPLIIEGNAGGLAQFTLRIRNAEGEEPATSTARDEAASSLCHFRYTFEKESNNGYGQSGQYRAPAFVREPRLKYITSKPNLQQMFRQSVRRVHRRR